MEIRQWLPAHSYQRSEWGDHINLRDPDNVAVEVELSLGAGPGIG
jgi:hypothetical protein